MSHDSRLDPYNDLGMNDTDARLLKDQDKLQILANWFDMQDAARSYDGPTDLQDDLRRIAARLTQLDEAVRLLRSIHKYGVDHAVIHAFLADLTLRGGAA